jgi:heat shock protein HspQ
MTSVAHKFSIGQLVHHLKFGYRGVVVDVDLGFGLSEAWYEAVARSRPPKDRPWYRVLVDGSGRETYVAERHLEADDAERPIEHPRIDEFFDSFRDGYYVRERALN